MGIQPAQQAHSKPNQNGTLSQGPKSLKANMVVINETLNSVHEEDMRLEAPKSPKSYLRPKSAANIKSSRTLGDIAHQALMANNPLAAQLLPANLLQGQAVSKPSSAVQKIKAVQKINEKHSKEYMRQYTIQPRAAASAGAKIEHGNIPAHYTTPSKIQELSQQIRAQSAPASRYLMNNAFQTARAQSAYSTSEMQLVKWERKDSTTLSSLASSFNSSSQKSGRHSRSSSRDWDSRSKISSPKLGKKQASPKIPPNDSNQKKLLGSTLDLKAGKSAEKKEVSRPKVSTTMEEAKFYLSILTDQECTQDEIEEALDSLKEKLEEDVAVATEYLYDLGCVKILVDLLKRSTHSVSLQKKICAILLTLAKQDDLTCHTIQRENGVLDLLMLISKMSEDTGSQVLEFGKKGRKGNGGILNSQTLASNSSMFSINEEAPNGLQMEGLLGDLIEFNYLETTRKMDKSMKQQAIEKLLLLLAKVDNLFTIVNAIEMETELPVCLQELMAAAQSITSSESAVLYMADPMTKELYFSSLTNDRGKKVVDVRSFAAGHGIAGWVALHEELVNVPDALKNEMFDQEVDSCGLSEGDTQTILCVPVIDRKGNLKGVIEVVNKLQGDGILPFTDEDESLLKILALLSGNIISSIQIFEKMSKTQEKVEVLLETTKMLGSTLDLDQLIKMIMDSAKGLLSADRCTLFLADVEKKQLRALIQGRDQIQEIRLAMNSGIAGYVYTSGESVNIPDAYKDSRFNPEVDKKTGYKTRNILCMPIKNINGQSIGVTQMINKFGSSFGEDDERILSSFSAQAAVAIEKSYLFKQTEDIRIYLQSILSSITSCVITLSESMKLMTVNRDWFVKALGVNAEYCMQNHADKWLGEENRSLLSDVLTVSKTQEPIFSAEYLLKSVTGGGTSVYVNYQIMPLIGTESKGIVLVLEDISSEKRAIMTLGRYMSPALAKQVMEEDGTQLGGKRKKVAILFTDIRSFTTLTESMEPHHVVEMLNHHFGDAVNAILAEQGILDKYIGDAVMAVFGVPFVNPDDSIHACNAALRMIESLKISNEKRAARGEVAIKIGVGINTGMVLSGNIGSVKRMEFSCIGDAVNLSSRIEGLTKYYKVTILITEFTEKETGGQFWTREIDTVVVTGKSTAVVIYELLGRKTPSTSVLAEAADLPVLTELPTALEQGLKFYAKALALYRNGDFQEAANNFALAIEVYDDGPSKTMMERCQHYLINPPEKSGQLVFHADHK